MIREREALMAFKVLTVAFPNHPVTPDVTALYVQTWTQLPFEDEGVLYEALNEHIREADWWPTIHQCVERYQVVARARIAIRQSQEQERAMARGMLPGMPAVPSDYGAEMVDVVRTALAEAFTVERQHRHLRGVPADETCPTCRQSDVIAAQVVARIDTLKAARGLGGPPAGQVTYACLRCHDATWVRVADLDVWKPCPECNTQAHDRWADGHWRPGHTCAECEGVRRGKNPIPA